LVYYKNLQKILETNLNIYKRLYLKKCYSMKYSLAGNVMRKRFNDKNPAKKYRKLPSSPRNSCICMRRIRREKCNSLPGRFRLPRLLFRSRVYLSFKGRPAWWNNAFNFTVPFECALSTPGYTTGSVVNPMSRG